MKKLKLTKVIASTLVAASILALNPIGASAEWKQDRAGWWYTEGSSYAKGWRVIDGSLYFFDPRGYMLDNRPNEFRKEYGINSSGQFANVTIDGPWAFCKQTGEIVAYVGSDSNVTIPDKIDNVAVKGIGIKAFYQCKSLTNVTLPNSINSMGRSSFYGCTNLTNINIPDGVKSITGPALSGCSSLKNISVGNNNTNYKSIDGVLCSKDGTTILCYPSGKVEENYTIPSSVTSIEYNAFAGCINLKSVTIPNSVTTIGYGAFYGCTNLTSINIPDSVTTIERSTFQECANLTNITLSNNLSDIGGNAFYRCKSLTNITLPNSLTNIEGGAFGGCTNLINVTIPDNVISIGNIAFNGCKNTNFYVKSEAAKQLLIESGVNQNKIILNS